MKEKISTEKITYDLLTMLHQQGYQALVMTPHENSYSPTKVHMEELLGNIVMVNLREDYPIAISDALAYFKELELENEQISL